MNASESSLQAIRVCAVFLTLLYGCLLGADADLRVVTTTKTNAEYRSVSTKDVFTRAGMTNLIRRTKTQAAVVQIRIHRFYHAGLLVGEYVAMADVSGFVSEAGCPYSMSFEFDRSKEVRMAAISQDGVVLDAFTCTNGVFSPVESSLLTKANSIGADVQELLSPEHVRKASPGEFGRDVERLIEKHKRE